jgi:hypothetical protein
MTSTIALVLDRNFGNRIEELANEMPVWIISSDVNDSVVDRTRRQLDGAANITLLLASANEAVSDACLRGLYEIDEHHGNYSTEQPYGQILVYGCNLDVVTPQVKHELGLTKLTKTEFGFVAERGDARSRVALASYAR